jgi:hypothetical protein
MEFQQMTDSAATKSLDQAFAPIFDLIEWFKKIDWEGVSQRYDAAIRRHIEAARSLAEKGWTIPAWMSITDPVDLCKLTEAELDRELTAAFVADNYRVLKERTQALIAVPEMVKWVPLLLEVRDSLISGRHRITVPALLIMLEGFASQHVVKEKITATRRRNLVSLIQDLGLHNKDGIEAMPAISNLTFLQGLFAESDFTQKPPDRINRHWVLHGRDECNWTLADAVRLFNALETICWLLDIILDRPPYDPAVNRSTSATAPDSLHALPVN